MNTTLQPPAPPKEQPWRARSGAPSTPGPDLRLSLVSGPARLPWRGGLPGDEIPAGDVLRAARAAEGRVGAFLLGGGNPLARGDLLGLLEQLAQLRPGNLGLCMDGAGLIPAVIQRLRTAGAERLIIPLHSARRDAHDWLVGQPGAFKTALRAIRACVDAGMPVATEILVTRPTVAHLEETVDVLTRAGVRSLCVRRLTAGDVAASPEFLALSPRTSLIAGDLERAATVALQRRARVVIRDFPLCVAPRLRRLFAALDAEAWVAADGTLELRTASGVGCPGCPGVPACAGAPSDYVARFGWQEFADAATSELRVREDVAAQQIVPASDTMVLSWRGPRRIRCDACGDATIGVEAEPTRLVRARLVEAASYRPAGLRLVGAELLAHPAAGELLYDAIRLFPRVECAGEASAVVEWPDVALRRLKDLRRIDVALYGADAPSHDAHCGIEGSFAATLAGVERLRAETAIPIGAYAIVHDARAVRAFAESWTRNELPGPPRFRLAATGGTLDELVVCASELPPGAVRSALLAVLPHCLSEAMGVAAEGQAIVGGSEAPAFGVAYGRRVAWSPCGSDPIGAFASCGDGTSCAATGCPGMAAGWKRSARSERWMLNS